MELDFKLNKKNIEYISNLTYLQEGILFHHINKTKQNLYSIQLSLNIEGVIDRSIFTKTWKLIITNNELLRTVFRWDKLSKPLQIVLKYTEESIRFYDLSVEKNPIKEVEKIKLNDYNEGFSLLDTPLRITLCKIDNFKHILLISNHHIIYDGWSTGIILKEFFNYYNILYHGNILNPVIKTKFKKFAEINRIVDQEGIGFWKNYLDSFEPNPISKYNHITSIEENSECIKIIIPKDRTDLIKLKCNQNSLTISDLLYNAWGILLSKYSNSNDSVFGTTVSGRNIKLKGIEEIVGLFINTIPFRLKISPDKTLNELVKENIYNTRERIKFENIPLSEILRHTGFNENELFESIVVIENYPLDESFVKESNSLKVSSFMINELTNYKLTLCIILNKEIEIHFKYFKSDFDSYIIENLSNHFTKIIYSILDNNLIKIQDIDILSKEEKNQLLYNFNNTQKEYPKGLFIFDLFSQQTQLFKEKIAIRYEDEFLTYSDLHQKVEHISKLLSSHGATTGDIVAIEQYRSINLIISILGTIRAGCAYLPIDPDYPNNRKSYILRDSATKFILSHSSTKNEYQEKVIEICIDEALNYPEEDKELCPNNQKSELCYIIYTSGSTGKPKGVQVSHQSVINLLFFLQEFYPVNSCDSYLFKTSFCFDVSISEIFGWILGGGHLTILEKGAEKDVDRIVSTISKTEVTHINFVPSMFKVFSDSLVYTSKEKFKTLKYIILAGEALHYDHIKKFVQLGIDAKIENLYGPTEATVYASKYSTSPKDINSSILIGRGISNVNLYILDQFNHLQAIGMAGELCISGICLGLGYLNNPELTKENFIEHPFETDDKLYKTGDLARWLPNGNIEFLGRIDQQVKIRGFRIELGEIESTLLNYEPINKAVVIAKGAKTEQFICAYYVSERKIESADLEKYLTARLPDYMIPSHFIQLNQIPITSNGKINRKELPNPRFQNIENFEIPKTILEKKLRELYSDILSIQENCISTDASLFVLGGNSLSVIRLLNIVKRDLNISLTIDDIFKLKTIEKISKYIESKSKTNYNNILPKEKRSFFELSPSQKRLYFLFQFDKSNLAYNLPFAAIIEGELNIAKINNIFKKLITRHESLRTSFQIREDKPVQVISNEVDFDVELFKSTDVHYKPILKKFIRPFDLSNPPLFRVGLIEINSNEHILMIDMHHIIMDEVSLRILTKEFLLLYNDLSLPKYRIHYKDYSIWLQSHEQRKEINRQKEFWLNEFSEEFSTLDIPTDFPRPSKINLAGNSIDFKIDESETHKLKSIAKNEGTTLFMVILSIYNILLSKLCNQEEIIIGTSITGRQHYDLENIIGLFVNTIPLRNYLKGELNFNNFLLNLQTKVLSCFDNQTYPFEELVDLLKIERNTSHNPLFDVMFLYQNKKEYELKIPEIILNPIEIEHAVSKFDVTLSAYENNESINLNIEYSTTLFKKTSIERIVNYFKKIVYEITTKPTLRLCDIEILSENEKKQILIDFNNTKKAYPKHKTINSIFEEVVLLKGNNIAVIFENKSLTYNELNNKSNQLARVISDKGIFQGNIIGIMMSRSHEMIVSIMGIIKAGCAYVPIDPEYPLERIKHIIEDSGLKLILTESIFEHLCKGIDNTIETITLLPIAQQLEDDENLKMTFSSSNLAYMIYTSGSTGKPKGIPIEHKSVINFINGVTSRISFENIRTILCLTTISFDIFILETLMPLLNGMTVVIARSSDQKNPDAIAKLIDSNKIDVIQITPSHLKVLLSNSLFLTSIKNVQILLIGGESFPLKLLQDLKEFFSGEIYNMYGPTETTVWSTIKNLTNDDSICIGTPIINTTIRIIDKHKHLVPIGIAGELCIGGDGVAKGYWQNDSLTNEKFIIDPITQDGLIFRTGDLAKWLPDGQIEHLGRIDNQVKIRGFRIELGEVETHLRTLEQVQDTVAYVKTKDGEKSLVAYYTSNNEIDSSTLRTFLSSKLPEYMVPTYFVWLEKIPLTPNGKINLRALPDPKTSVISEFIVPRTKEEKILTQIWSDVLGAENISINDNFFLSGGDSIKSIIICSRLRNAGYELTVSEIFTNPTIEKLSRRLKQIKTIPNQHSITGEISLTPYQRLLLKKLGANKNHLNHSIMLSFSENLSETIIHSIFTKLQVHHDALRIVFRVENDLIIQENKGVEHPISLNVSDLKEEKLTNIKLQEISNTLQSEIDIKTGPLMKLGLIQMNNGSRLLIIVHCMIVDSISLQILLEDFDTLYLQYKENKTLALPSKSESFQSWSNHFEKWTLNETQTKAELYPKSIKELELCSNNRNYSNENKITQNSSTESFELNKEDTSKLVTAIHPAFSTQINDILITSLLICLNKKLGLNSIIINLEVSGRGRFYKELDTSRTIGCFNDIYPVLIEFKNTSISEIVKHTKEALRISKENSNFNEYATKHLPQINFIGYEPIELSSNNFQLDFLSNSEMILYKTELYDWNIFTTKTNEQLNIHLAYSESQYEKKVIAELMSLFRESLLEVINYCHEYGKQELTPSDLTYKSLSIEQLNILQSQYNIQDIYPLSPMQEGMLYHSLLNNKANHYFEQIEYNISGNFDIHFFKKTLCDLSNRHGALRTIFIHEGYYRALQIVLKENKIDFIFKNIQNECINYSTEKVVASYRLKEQSQSFNLSNNVPIRLIVLQTDGNEYKFIWSFHHIIMDGWCMGILINEINILYINNKTGKDILLPIANPYSQYIEWLEKKDKNESLNYWRNYLNSYENIATLPSKKQSLSEQSNYNFDSQNLIVNKEITQQLHIISREYGVSLNTIFQCSWAILLAKYNSTEDVIFGSVVSGRPAEIAGIEQMVGLFINTIPVRVCFRKEDTFKSITQNIQQIALNCENYHYNSLAEIQTLNKLGRGLFNHIIVFENYPISKLINNTQTDFTISKVKVCERSNYDLMVVIIPEDEIQIRIDYSKDFYENNIIKMTLDHFNNILEQIALNNEEQILSLEIISSQEKHQLLYNLNFSNNLYPTNKTIHELFRNQVVKTPNKVAIQFNDQFITYTKLDEITELIAITLRDKGIKPDNIVGLLMDRSIEVVIGMLSILKAGGAYLPIDINYPKNRKDYIISDSGITMILTTKEITNNYNSILSIYIDNLEYESKKTKTVENLNIQSNLCYVIYTSGTTGNPKGVMVEHKNVVRLFFNDNFQFDFNQDDVWTMFHNHCFDFSVWEIYGALLFGGKLIIIPKQIAMDTLAYLKILKDKSVTILNQTPSAFYILSQEELLNTNRELNLKYVIFGGEALSPNKLEKWKDKYPNTKLINMFGITETTVHVTYKEIGNYEIINNISNIGKPIPTLSLYIFDKHQKLQPQGIIGEIYVGGAGVARGYLGKQELTAEKFIENPYNSNEKLYRSGDLGRILSSGEIEYIGRIDHQVQLRGFRIELGEIENQITSFDNIDNATVITNYKEDNTYLIAYYVSSQKIDESKLKDYLRTKLPDYMLPSFYIHLEKLPLNINGKLDIKALPKPTFDSKEDFVMPSNEIEEKLIEIWSEELGVNKEDISVNKSFFELGGHSLKITTIISKIHKTFNVKLPLKEVVANPTIISIAILIKNIRQIKKQNDSEEHNKIEITI